MKKALLKLCSALLLISILLTSAGCSFDNGTDTPSKSGQTNGDPSESNKAPIYSGELELTGSVDLMKDVSGDSTAARPADDRFIYSQAAFGLNLFKKSIDNEKNSLISPLSVMLALAMTANGAEGETLAEMEALLGGDIPIGELNEYLRTYMGSLPSSEKARLEIANSIWFRDDEKMITVKDSFLKNNANYYGASVYKSPFDDSTVNDINNWVAHKTEGMITDIVNEIPPLVVMHIINAICFDAEWLSPYNSEYDVLPGSFHGLSGESDAELMWSEEGRFVSDDNARGFIKKYKNGYSFMAILPNEGISLSDYINTLEGDDLVKLYKNAAYVNVNAALPKFKYEYSVSLVDSLKALGMNKAFTGGFGNLGSSSLGEIFISNVSHKTFIEVNNMGTRAAAVTDIEMSVESCPPRVENVVLDRPFLYAIVDDATGLPIFIGTLLSVQ
jgi:serpin B